MVLKSKTDKNQSSVETTILEVLRGPHKARGIMWSVHVRVRKGFLEKEMIDFTELSWKNKEKKKKPPCEREPNVQRQRCETQLLL